MPQPKAFESLIVMMWYCLFVSIALADESELAEEFTQTIRPALVELCGECHDPEDDSDPVRFLRSETADQITRHRGIWMSAAEQLRNRTMPPGDKAQPSEPQRLELMRWIESYMESTACSQGDFAGTPAPRRLNRDQYTNAIHDLTGKRFDFVEVFPADGSGGEGFDNNGETLFLPPLLLERYMEVAQSVLDDVIAVEPFDTTFVTDKVRSGETVRLVDEKSVESYEHRQLLPGQSTSVSMTAWMEDDYGLSFKATHNEKRPMRVVINVDGIDISKLEISPNKKAKEHWTPIHFARGPHQITLRVPDDGAPITIQWLHLYQEKGTDKDREERERLTAKLFAPGNDRLGSDKNEESKQVERILGAFASKAWRRPAIDQEVDQLMSLHQRGIDRGESMVEAIKLPLKAILVSPKFLFVAEQAHDEPGIHRISDLELASRLALFLWHSLPDETLVRLALENRLHESGVLKKQVRRMLEDKRSDRFAEAFAGQWLGTVAIGRTKIPDTNHFKPVYTTELVTDFRRQVSETMALVLRENRAVTDWIDCDYVVVNKRLAKHYDLEPIPESNDEFVKVSLKRSPRPGVLGMGAVHLLTSYSRRTSPVLRGGWVLETIFGAHLPAPPPDAGDLKGGEKEVKEETVRQRLEKHRDNATCAACHDLIDPIGFALENYDVIGRWRDKEGKQKIDAKGSFPSGEEFEGPQELRSVLMDRKDEFVRQFTRQMLGFALARSLEDADSCTVSALTKRLEDSEYRIEELVIGIVESIPFQYRQGVSADETLASKSPTDHKQDD